MRARPLVIYGASVVCLVAFGFLRAAAVRHGVEQALLQNVSISLPVTAADVGAWARSGQAQADLLARVLDEDLRSSRANDASRHRAILKSLDTDDGFVAGWMLDTAGIVLAAAGDTAFHPSSEHVSGMALARSARGTYLDFVAIAGGARVVLRASPGARAFPDLNPARPNNLTGRTTLFLHRGDSLLVAATRSNAASEFPPAFPASARTEPITAAARGKPGGGIAPNRSGRSVAYAVVPLGAPEWVLLREQEVDEVLSPIWVNVAIELALVGTIVLLLATFANYRLRSSRLRREHELSRIRADFVASVSHELRTPLAQIRMYAELLRKGSMRTPQDTDRALSVIEKESHRLNILVDNVLNFTRLRRQASVAPGVPTRVDDDIAHVVEAFAPLARERSVAVERCVESGLTAAVDSLPLRQIVLNFLENAVKYGPVGQTVRVEARSVGSRARISVEDRGPGVPAAEHDAVWQPFVRGTAATTAGSSGSGIGLAVVRDLVLQNGGTYGIEDVVPAGARFFVEFPRLPTS